MTVDYPIPDHLTTDHPTTHHPTSSIQNTNSSQTKIKGG